MAEGDRDTASSPTSADEGGLDAPAAETLDARAAADKRFRQQVEPLRRGELLSERYRIEREVGRGGMGAVYEAVHVLTDKRVALKWLFPSGSRNAELRARFLREAKASGLAKHENIVDIYDIAEHQRGVYLVMELLEGESLRERMDRGPIGARELVSLLMPALRGVAAAHAQGIVHRDLKPANIFLCARGQGVLPEAKVLDFGISKLRTEGERTLTVAGAVMGTPHYMAPEQARGEAELDARADVYSLGVILYEALSGRRPFLALSPAQLFDSLAKEDPPRLRAHTPSVTEELERVVMKALARDREQRYQSVTELAYELEPMGMVTFAPGLRLSSLSDELRPVPVAAAGATNARASLDSRVPVPQRSKLGYAIAVGLLIALVLSWAMWSASSGQSESVAPAGGPPNATAAAAAAAAAAREQAEEPPEPSAPQAREQAAELIEGAPPARREAAVAPLRGEAGKGNQSRSGNQASEVTEAKSEQVEPSAASAGAAAPPLEAPAAQGAAPLAAPAAPVLRIVPAAQPTAASAADETLRVPALPSP